MRTRIASVAFLLTAPLAVSGQLKSLPLEGVPSPLPRHMERNCYRAKLAAASEQPNESVPLPVLHWAASLARPKGNPSHDSSYFPRSAAVGQVTSEPVKRVALEPYPVSPYLWHAIVETPGFYQTAEIDTRTGSIDSDPQRDVLFKPTDTPTRAPEHSFHGHAYVVHIHPVHHRAPA